MFQEQTTQRFDVIATTAQDGLGCFGCFSLSVNGGTTSELKYIVVKAPQTNLIALIGDEIIKKNHLC